MKSTAIKIGLAVALVLTVAVVLHAVAQPGQEGGPPGAPPGMGGPGGPGMGPMGPPPTPALVVTAQGVYVMMGPQILRLDPETLKVLAKAELPRPEPPKQAKQ
jgi:hypothetical protein